MENNNLFEDMPEAPTPPKLPKYFPDLQGENRGLTPGAGWYQNKFLPWIQNQDPKELVGYGIGMFLLAGKFARILTDFFDFPKFCFFAFRNCCSLSIRSVHLPKAKILELCHLVISHFWLSPLNQNPKNNDDISYFNILTQK